MPHIPLNHSTVAASADYLVALDKHAAHRHLAICQCASRLVCVNYSHYGDGTMSSAAFMNTSAAGAGGSIAPCAAQRAGKKVGLPLEPPPEGARGACAMDSLSNMYCIHMGTIAHAARLVEWGKIHKSGEALLNQFAASIGSRNVHFVSLKRLQLSCRQAQCSGPSPTTLSGDSSSHRLQRPK